MEVDCKKGVMNGPLKFLTARKILPLLDLLAKFKRVLACSCSPNFCVARQLAKQIFNFCSCSQKNRSARHARECSQRPFVTPQKRHWDVGHNSASGSLYSRWKTFSECLFMQEEIHKLILHRWHHYSRRTIDSYVEGIHRSVAKWYRLKRA